MTPIPDAGDLVWTDLNPVVGTEQAGRRPALIVSSRIFHEVSRRAVVCPITNNMQSWPTKIELPDSCHTRGMVLVDQLRAVDRHARPFRFIERCPEDFVDFVRGHIARILEIPIPD